MRGLTISVEEERAVRKIMETVGEGKDLVEFVSKRFLTEGGGGDAGEGQESDDPDSGGCFTAGTGVIMADGSWKRIADVAVGDEVLGHDFKTQRHVASPVIGLFRLRAEGCLRLNGLEVTETHPFAVGEDEWRQAGDLRVGDRVLGDGPVEIESMGRVEGKVDVFNLTVGGTHNFHVGEGGNGYLVHNKGATLCFAEGAQIYLVHNKGALGCFSEDARVYLVHNKGPAAGCFAEGSPVGGAHIPTRNIESIEVGDAVSAFDLKDGAWKPRTVTELQVGKRKRDYFVINGTLKVSPNHRLWFNDKGVPASEVEVGGWLYDAALNKVPVESVRYVDEEANRYNIILGRQKNLAYVVDGVLVFNGW